MQNDNFRRILYTFLKQHLNQLQHIFCILVILAIGAIVYRPIVFSGGAAIQENDNWGVYYPAFYFAKHALLDGELPLWDPYQLLGQPMAFNTYSLLYPGLLLFLKLPFPEFYPRHMELLLVAHLVMGGLAMFFGGIKLGLSKWSSMVSSAIFLIAPSTNNFVQNPPAAFLMGWLPIIFSLTVYIFRSRKPLSKMRLETFILIISLGIAFLATSLPLLVYTYISIGLIFLFYLYANHKVGPKTQSVYRLVKKFLVITLVPNLLIAFYLLPLTTYFGETVRHIPIVKFTRIGPLYLGHIWTMFFPGFAIKISDAYAYFGLFTLFAIFGLLLRVGKRFFPQTLALFSLISSFWFIFAVEKSPLYRAMVYLPLLGSLRFSYRALAISVIFIAWIVGLVVDSVTGFVKSKEKDATPWTVLRAMLPLTLLVAVALSYKNFQEIFKQYPLWESGQTVIDYFITNFPTTFIGIAIFITLLKRRSANKLPRSLAHTFWVIALSVIVSEQALNYSIHAYPSPTGGMYPYEGAAVPYEGKYPEIVKNTDPLSRIESFGNETPLFPYYFNFQSVNGIGYWPQGTHPISYYYIWSKDAAYIGHTYQKPILDTIASTIRIDSPIYKLIGVRYFITDGVPSRVIPFKERGIGEFIDTYFNQYEYISGITIAQPASDLKRRVTKARIFSNGSFVGDVNFENAPGPQTAYISPIWTNNIRIEASEVGLNGWPVSDGIVIEELTFLGMGGREIPVERIKEIKPSSTFCQSSPMYLTDKLPIEWESDNLVSIRRTVEDAGLIYIRDGVSESPDYLPKAFVTSDYAVSEEEDAMLEQLHSETFDPKQLIIYEPDKKKMKSLTKRVEKIEKSDYFQPANVDEYKRNKVTLSVATEKPGFLVLTDMYSNGWRAYLDGKRQPILRAYGTLRAIELPKQGDHKIVFKYIPPDFYKGAFISLVTLLGLLKFVYKDVAEKISKVQGYIRKHLQKVVCLIR